MTVRFINLVKFWILKWLIVLFVQMFYYAIFALGKCIGFVRAAGQKF